MSEVAVSWICISQAVLMRKIMLYSQQVLSRARRHYQYRTSFHRTRYQHRLFHPRHMRLHSRLMTRWRAGALVLARTGTRSQRAGRCEGCLGADCKAGRPDVAELGRCFGLCSAPSLRKWDTLEVLFGGALRRRALGGAQRRSSFASILRLKLASNFRRR